MENINHPKLLVTFAIMILIFAHVRIKFVIITIMILVLSFTPINLYSQNASAQNMTDSNLTGNATEPSVVEPLGRPEDLANGDGKFSLNARNIAIELTKITPAELSQYPITDLSREDIQSVLGLLNPRVLAKVLLNLPQEELMKMQVMLSPSAFNQTLNRLLEVNKTQVEDRLS